MKSEWNVTFKGRTVTNPIARVALGLLTATFGLLATIFVILLVITIICLSPVLIPLHLVQRALGMQGLYRSKDGKVEVIIDHTSFYFRK